MLVLLWSPSCHEEASLNHGCVHLCDIARPDSYRCIVAFDQMLKLHEEGPHNMGQF